MRICHRVIAVLCAVSAHSCISLATPESFTATGSHPWSMIELRSDVQYEHAWDTVFQLLTKNFDLDRFSRDDGYLLTNWLYTWSGQYLAEYRVRVTVKFSPDRKTLQFLPEAQVLDGDGWEVGTDTRLVSTLRTDLMGTIGRTAR